MMKIPSGAKESVDYARSLGFEVVRTRKHIIMRKGRVNVTISKSPGTIRSVRNERHQIDRANKKLEEPNVR
jgi:hypothetical protein